MPFFLDTLSCVSIGQSSPSLNLSFLQDCWEIYIKPTCKYTVGTHVFIFFPSSPKAGTEPERESRSLDSWNSALCCVPNPCFPFLSGLTTRSHSLDVSKFCSCSFTSLPLLAARASLEARWETLGRFLELTFNLDPQMAHKAALFSMSSSRTRSGDSEIR